MSNQIHTVLGARGAIGRAVIKELKARNLPYKAVSRSKGGAGSEAIFQADLLNTSEANEAIAGSNYVYLCIGLPYKTQVWETQWEQVMCNVIDACSKHQAKLIFLDNIYMYSSPLPVPFDENTTQVPGTKKGQARKRTASLLQNAMDEKKIEGLIARSADFYGEAASNSPFYIAFLERMLEGKNPQTLSPGNIKHTYANVLDNGRALVDLALCEDCYGQVWHLPVGKPTTTQEMLDLFNNELNTNFQLSVMPKAMRSILSIFIPILKEAGEMQYQFEKEYIMSFKKFEERFPDFTVTPYEEGVAQMVNWFKK